MSVRSRKAFAVIVFAVSSVGMALFVVRSRQPSSTSEDATNVSSRVSQDVAAKFAAFEAKEQKVAETVWAKERLAQECGRTFEALWNSLNAATNKLTFAASFPVSEIVLGQWNRPQILPHEIELREPMGPGPALSAEQWRRFLEEFERSGWQLAQTEFRHNRFDTDEAGQPKQSHFYFSAHLTNSARSERAILDGDLIVDWAPKRTSESVAENSSRRPEEAPPSKSEIQNLSEPERSPSRRPKSEIDRSRVMPSATDRTISQTRSEKGAAVKRIDASRLTIKARRGEPPFKPILLEQITPPEKSPAIDPLILYDLDGDGRSEIILAAKNLVYRRHGDDRYQPEPLCRHPPGLIFTGIIADFDGDGTADFLCAKPQGLLLFKGSELGTFDQPGRLAWPANPQLKNVMVLTCGDIDHDGDLDLFLGQYKIPTLGQILRPNFHDADDGHPAYLLLNDGHGNFTDATEAAGLEKKRSRRVFSASFVDLNDDRNLDLLVVSDFAGADIYQNDGHGHFTDVTRDWIADSHAFGMAHALADFNADGRLDFLMIGMNSPTVDRLEHLRLTRPGFNEDRTMRRRMTFGNRLYLARSESGFEQTSLNNSIARSGWSWGCTAADFDNDGFPDVYIANGHESKQSVRDYEPEFWLHDIFVDDSVDDVTATAYFTSKFARTRGAGWSYGGYEKNRLYLNQRGGSFVEIGHLMGVALEQDSRNVMADDLDGDGRMDLLVTTFEVWPEVKQTLRVYKNTLRDGGHWIGFRFREERGNSPIGAQVALRYDNHSTVRQMVTGDSFRSQHANTVHFGLGEASQLDSVEIRWPSGQAVTLREPAVNRYYSIRASGENSLNFDRAVRP